MPDPIYENFRYCLTRFVFILSLDFIFLIIALEFSKIPEPQHNYNQQQLQQQVVHRARDLSELGDRRVQIDFRSLHANFNQN